jgi:hypothetical protein
MTACRCLWCGAAMQGAPGDIHWVHGTGQYSYLEHVGCGRLVAAEDYAAAKARLENWCANRRGAHGSSVSTRRRRMGVG